MARVLLLMMARMEGEQKHEQARPVDVGVQLPEEHKEELMECAVVVVAVVVVVAAETTVYGNP